MPNTKSRTAPPTINAENPACCKTWVTLTAFFDNKWGSMRWVFLLMRWGVLALLALVTLGFCWRLISPLINLVIN